MVGAKTFIQKHLEFFKRYNYSGYWYSIWRGGGGGGGGRHLQTDGHQLIYGFLVYGGRTDGYLPSVDLGVYDVCCCPYVVYVASSSSSFHLLNVSMESNLRFFMPNCEGPIKLM